MKRRILLALLLCLTGPTIAGAQQRPDTDPRGPYVDPLLRALQRPGAREAVQRAVVAEPQRMRPPRPSEEKARARASAPRSGPYSSLALEEDRRTGQTRVGVLVQLRDPIPASLAALRRAGAEIGTVVGDVATARVPIDALDLLSRTPELRRIEAARRLSISHDTSIVAIRATDVRQRDGDLWYGSTGDGVIVGLYDTGIDYKHGDFRDGRGRSRLLGLWDHAIGNGTPPDGFAYGHYCDQNSLTDESCPSTDRDGHGTHVAGTMAGDGSAAGTGQAFRYAGVAPMADLLVVKGGNFLAHEIVEAVDWIFRTAEKLGRPAVVNLSLGAQSGARDGSSAFERALDNLSGPGRIIVAAAGNDASNGNFVEGSLPAYRFHAMDVPVVGSPIEFVIRVPGTAPRAGICNDYGLIEVWYDGADRLDIEIVRPDGEAVSAAFGTFRQDSSASGFIWIDNAFNGANPGNGDHQALIEISDCNRSGALAQGLWVVRATPTSVGSGGEPVHLWISQTEFGESDALRGVSSNFDNGYIVSSPATAHDVIAVGAYVTRTCWQAQNGVWCWTAREEVGDIAHFSNGGPTRDGRLKPEISAPGRTIISTLSSQITGIPEELVAPDGVHVVLQGTSMAAPHVAGAVALMLQHDPTLTPAEARAILQRSALRDEFTTRSYTGEPGGATPNNQWGHGKLDVHAAVEDLVDPALIAGVLVVPDVDSLALSGKLQLWAQPYDALGNTISAAVTWSSSDPAVATVDQTGLVTGHAFGTTTISATAGGKSGQALLTVSTPSTLIVEADAVPVPGEMSTKSGTRIVLLKLHMRVDGPEDMRVERIGFTLTGDDPLARAHLIRDLDGNAQIDEGEITLADDAVALLPGEETTVLLSPDELVIAARDSATALLALQLSGNVPNGAGFQARYEPETLSTVGVQSGETDRIEQAPGAVSSAPVATTVLRPDEVFALSENPVMSDRVIFNFRERPRVAAVYMLNGSRVVDLLPRMEVDGRVEWDLTNEKGADVAPGIYLVVFNVGGDLITEKLIIVRRTDEEE